MRVLLSVYACETGKGSEPEVGFRTLLAAAAEHEVWVLTRENNIPSLAGFLAGHPHQDRVHLIGFDLGGREQRIKKALGRAGLQWYYNLWQRQVAAVAADLDRDVNFDVIHHVTFASYWTGAGVSSVGKAFVWGPVGGGVEVPIGLIPELGLRGFAEEIARSTIRRMVALSPRVQSSARRAKEVLVQNKDTARRVQTDAAIRIVSNATCVASNVPVTSGERTAEIVVVGRLVPWKAPVLALRALRYVRNEGARLVFYGRGPETKRCPAPGPPVGTVGACHVRRIRSQTRSSEPGGNGRGFAASLTARRGRTGHLGGAHSGYAGCVPRQGRAGRSHPAMAAGYRCCRCSDHTAPSRSGYGSCNRRLPAISARCGNQSHPSHEVFRGRDTGRVQASDINAQQPPVTHSFGQVRTTAPR